MRIWRHLPHLPASPEVCHQALGGHLASGVSGALPANIGFIKARCGCCSHRNNCGSSSSSNDIILFKASHLLRGCGDGDNIPNNIPVQERRASECARSLSLAPTSTPNPQLQPTDPAILPSDCQQLSCQHPTGQPTGHQQRQGQQHHQEQDQEPEFHQGPFHVTDDLQHPASEAASERHQLLIGSSASQILLHHRI